MMTMMIDGSCTVWPSAPERAMGAQSERMSANAPTTPQGPFEMSSERAFTKQLAKRIAASAASATPAAATTCTAAVAAAAAAAGPATAAAQL